MIALRARAAKPSLTKRILQGIVFTSVGLTGYFLYTRNWTVDENTKWLILLLNVVAFTPYFYYLPIESVRNGSSVLRTLLQVIISYGYTACLFGFVYTFASNICGRNEQPFKPPLHGIDGIYFSFTTLATVGFGDIVPVRTFAKGLVTLEILVGIVYTLFMFAIVSAYVVRKLDGPHDGS